MVSYLAKLEDLEEDGEAVMVVVMEVVVMEGQVMAEVGSEAVMEE